MLGGLLGARLLCLLYWEWVVPQHPLSPSSPPRGWESEGSPAAWGLSCTAAQPGVKWAEKNIKAHPPRRLQSLARLQSGASVLILPSCPSLCFHRFAAFLG